MPETPRPLLLGAATGLVSAVLFGASVPITKRLLPEVAPLLLAGLLYLGGGLAVGSVRLLARRRIVEASLGRADLPRVLAIVLLGGVVGPLALVNGLRSVSGVSGALLLNLEGPLTVLVALTLFREHLGPRAGLGAALVFGGACLLAIPGGEGGSTRLSGVLLLATACAAWALDNNLTQGLAGKDPWQLVIAKTLGAGTGMVSLALVLGDPLPGGRVVVAALVLGALAYGASVLLDAFALRLLGAAREAAFFATAPFAGALLSVPVLGERLGGLQLAAGAVMVLGVAILVRERHGHEHAHEALEHTHRHVHDTHHQHPHPEGVDPASPHAHPHRHAPLTHAHAHVSDAHHRHAH
ncbi:MAG TPA: EamA family transporter [Myxococcaceae bacterium]|nr:EamA family transporter [Myxococcaceae bacterium]